MGEECTRFRAEFNGSLRIESRPERLTSEAGAVLLREVLERLGITAWLVERLEDPRDPALVTHPLAEILHTSLLLLGQGWRDQDDADAARARTRPCGWRSPRGGAGSPLRSSSRQVGAPAAPEGLASQPTLSRLGRTLSGDGNRAVLREGLLETAARRIRASRGGHRLRYVTVDPLAKDSNRRGTALRGHPAANGRGPGISADCPTSQALAAVGVQSVARRQAPRGERQNRREGHSLGRQQACALSRCALR